MQKFNNMQKRNDPQNRLLDPQKSILDPQNLKRLTFHCVSKHCLSHFPENMSSNAVNKPNPNKRKANKLNKRKLDTDSSISNKRLASENEEEKNEEVKNEEVKNEESANAESTNEAINNNLVNESRILVDDCSICLQAVSNKTKLNNCVTHVFCFECIKHWSTTQIEANPVDEKPVTRCPLCKTVYTGYITEIKSDTEYKLVDVDVIQVAIFKERYTKLQKCLSLLLDPFAKLKNDLVSPSLVNSNLVNTGLVQNDLVNFSLVQNNLFQPESKQPEVKQEVTLLNEQGNEYTDYVNALVKQNWFARYISNFASRPISFTVDSLAKMICIRPFNKLANFSLHSPSRFPFHDSRKIYTDCLNCSIYTDEIKSALVRDLLDSNGSVRFTFQQIEEFCNLSNRIDIEHRVYSWLTDELFVQLYGCNQAVFLTAVKNLRSWTGVFITACIVLFIKAYSQNLLPECSNIVIPGYFQTMSVGIANKTNAQNDITLDFITLDFTRYAPAKFWFDKCIAKLSPLIPATAEQFLFRFATVLYLSLKK